MKNIYFNQEVKFNLKAVAALVAICVLLSIFIPFINIQACHPSLSINKSVNKTEADPGDEIVYTLNYQNIGDGRANNVIIRDPFNNLNQNYLTFISATPSPSSGNDTWNIGNLNAGASGQISIRARISDSIPYGTTEIRDRFSIDSDNTSFQYSNYVSTWITREEPQDPYLVISKSINKTEADPGDEIVYTLNYQNTGDGDASNVTIEDPFINLNQNYLTFISSTPNPSFGNDVWEINNLGPGQSGQITIKARISESVPEGTTEIRNRGSIESDELSLIYSNYVSVWVTKNNPGEPSLSINKSVNRTEADPGDEIVYTLNYENIGNGDATDVVIRDPFINLNQNYLTFITATPYPNSGNNTWNIGTLNPGESGQITIRARIDDSVPYGSLEIKNRFNIDSDETSLEYSNYVSTWIHTENNDDVDLTIEKLVRNTSNSSSWYSSVDAEPEDEVEFSIEVRNTTNSTARNVKVWDNLPSRLEYVSGSTRVDGSYRSDGVVDNGIYINDLGSYDSKTVRFRARVDNEDRFYSQTTVLTNYGYTRADNHGSISDTATVRVEKEENNYDDPALNIDKLVRNLTRGSSNWTNTVYANPGDELEFLITVESIGDERANDVKVRDSLPSKIDYISGSTRIDGSYKGDGIIYSGGIWIGDLNEGDEKEVRFKARVDDEDRFSSSTTTLTNTAYTWADEVSRISDYAKVKVEKDGTQSTYSLAISKLGRNLSYGQTSWFDSFVAGPGEEIEFSIQITNIGNTDLNDVRVWDALPSNISIINNSTSIDGASWGGDVIGTGLDLGILRDGQTKTIKFRARIAHEDNFNAGSTTLINTAYGDADDVSQVSDQASVIVNKPGKILGAKYVDTGANPMVLFLLTIISIFVAFMIYCRLREDKLLEALNSESGNKLYKTLIKFYFRMKFFFTATKLRFKRVYW